ADESAGPRPPSILRCGYRVGLVTGWVWLPGDGERVVPRVPVVLPDHDVRRLRGVPVRLECELDRRRAVSVEIDAVDPAQVLEQERQAVLVGRHLELVTLLQPHRARVDEVALSRQLTAERL